ncbi:hypothetical protein EC2845650_5282 [Escherichia coli 2845650]|nr:hypothetical protein EC2845650_5282 [Escherichia coli 2845650]
MLAERGIFRLTGLSREGYSAGLATAASMTENGHRRDMHLPNRLPDSGNGAGRQNPAQIGDCWVFTPPVSEC